MSYLSVKELADELEISKQAIHKRIKQLPPNLKPKLVKGAYKLSVETANYIRSEVQSPTEYSQPNNKSVDTTVNHQSVDDNQWIAKESLSNNYEDSDKSESSTENKKKESSTDNQPVDDEVVAVRLLVEQKDNEIKRLADELTEKNKQINSLHLLIDQQQQLTLQTQFRNNKLELQLEEFKKDESDKTEAIPDDKQTKKKWWHFFNDFL